MQSHAQLLPVALALISLGCSACVSSKYKLAKPADARPAVPLNLVSTQPPIEATLNTVIVYQGPGSWKREAFWDEYVLTLANRGTKPVAVESASLAGLTDKLASPWRDPWALDDASRDAEQRRFGLEKDALTDVDRRMGGGFGTVLGTGAIIGATTGGSGMMAASAALGGGILALPVYIGATIYGNVSSRHEIENEFHHRRLDLPATLSPGQSVHGSLFFPITPGPQRLTLRCISNDAPLEVVIDLAPITHLHLKARPSQESSAP